MEQFDANEFEEMDENNADPDALDHEGEEEEEEDLESMEHIRSKLNTMEAEAKKIMALSRQIGEKDIKSNNDKSNNNNNNNHVNNNTTTSGDSNNTNASRNKTAATTTTTTTTTTTGNATTSNDTTAAQQQQQQQQGNLSNGVSATEYSYGDHSTDPNSGDGKEDQKVLDERSVFVKNINKETEADQLKEYFESCGAVERITILANKFTGEAKGCAYIQFKSKVAVANALLLDGKIWQDKEIEVKPKRTNLPAWMMGRGRARGRGGYRGGGPPFRGRGAGGRGAYFAYRGYRGGYRGRGYWSPYAGY